MDALSSSATVERTHRSVSIVGLIWPALLGLSLVAWDDRVLTADPVPFGMSESPTTALALFKPGAVVPLEEGFRDPPPISRVQCWWQPSGSAFTREEITRDPARIRVGDEDTTMASARNSEGLR